MKRRILMIALPNADCLDYQQAAPIGSISISKTINTDDKACEELLENMAGYLAFEIKRRENRE